MPSSSSCASNVPMHPRSDVCSDLGETVFQVTKSGYSAIVGKDEVDVAGVSVPSESVEPEDGVEMLLADAELSTTRRRAGDCFFEFMSAL